MFIAGATGYLGSRLIPELISRGHRVIALARSGSQDKIVPGCDIVIGDALNADSYKEQVKKADTFVHLVGVPHPSPAKAPLFRTVDLAALRQSVAAAEFAGTAHFIYLSVAHPARVMKAYVASRQEAEQEIRRTSLQATFLRPWYVLGPGHRWAYALLPFYWLFERLPPTRESALRLGLITLPQMIGSLVDAVENPPQEKIRIVEVPEIRRAGLRPALTS